MWWYSHLPFIAVQIIAIYFYYTGSRRFYSKEERPILIYIAIGIMLDFVVMSTPMFHLPKMDETLSVPWTSILFRMHILSAMTGMVGFIAMLIYLWIKGKNHPYKKLRIFQYKFLFTSWMFGVSIALISFAFKVIFGTRIYDYF